LITRILNSRVSFSNIIKCIRVRNYIVELSSCLDATGEDSCWSNEYAVCVGILKSGVYNSDAINSESKRFDSKSEAEEYMVQLVETYTLLSV